MSSLIKKPMPAAKPATKAIPVAEALAEQDAFMRRQEAKEKAYRKKQDEENKTGADRALESFPVGSYNTMRTHCQNTCDAQRRKSPPKVWTGLEGAVKDVAAWVNENVPREVENKP
jgi:hypothetical protein